MHLLKFYHFTKLMFYTKYFLFSPFHPGSATVLIHYEYNELKLYVRACAYVYV